MVVCMMLLLSPAAVRAAGEQTMYEGDNDRKIKEDIEDIFGVYIINPDRRHSDEKVHISRDRGGNMTVELRVFYDQRRAAPERLKCFAYRWLLLGRFGEGGARELFARYPKVENADIMFYTLTSKRTVDRDGKYSVTKEPVWFIRARVTRDRAKQLDWQDLQKNMAIDGSRCAKAGEKAISAKRFRKYIEAKDRDP